MTKAKIINENQKKSIMFQELKLTKIFVGIKIVKLYIATLQEAKSCCFFLDIFKPR